MGDKEVERQIWCDDQGNPRRVRDGDQRLVIDGVVLPPSRVISQLKSWSKRERLQLILLGNGTSSEQWNPALQRLASIEIVEERGTTLRARERYWQLWPVRGWRQLLPRGLRLPPGELDAVAALVMVIGTGHRGQPPDTGHRAQSRRTWRTR